MCWAGLTFEQWLNQVEVMVRRSRLGWAAGGWGRGRGSVPGCVNTKPKPRALIPQLPIETSPLST